ncbi:hypothetical protein ANANG_G00296670, partial [Anguilla anguilla]
MEPDLDPQQRHRCVLQHVHRRNRDLLAPESRRRAGDPALSRVLLRSALQHHEQRVPRVPPERNVGDEGELLAVPGHPDRGEEEQAALPDCRDHKLPGPLHLPGGPAGGIPPLHALEEHPLPEEHHPLEPDHRLHPAPRHLVHRPAHHEPQSAREQRDLVPAGDGGVQLLPRDQLLLDVRRGLLPAHGHRAHLLHRQAAQVDVHLHRLVHPFPHHRRLGHRQAVLRQRKVSF